MASLDMALEERIAAIEARLRDQLPAEGFALVRELRCLEELATLAACEAWQRRMLDAVVRHFPDHELALRGVVQHVLATDGDCDTWHGVAAGGHGR